ncbi:MAG TPA: ATP-binding protein [Thermoanaerobaculia bacterium]|nr:ATP-binding protein [Thermoanaerobaculia bacterium]
MAVPSSSESPSTGVLTPEEFLRCFSVLSHDLKSPIFTIDGFSDLLMGDYADKLDAEGVDFLTRIRGAALQMRKILDDMGHILKLLSKPPVIQTVSLQQIVEELQLRYNYLLEESGTTLELAADLPSVEGDPERIRESLSSLLSNAILFNDRPAGERTVTISISRENQMIRCCVVDNGIGIDPRYLGQIFDLGLKLDKARGGGPGFGLYLARRAIETSGGSLTVDSTLGAGSRFCLLMPASE